MACLRTGKMPFEQTKMSKCCLGRGSEYFSGEPGEESTLLKHGEGRISEPVLATNVENVTSFKRKQIRKLERL